MPATVTTTSPDAPPPEARPPVHAAGSALRRLAGGAARDLSYLAAVCASSSVGFTVWVTGLSVTLALIIVVFGLLAWAGTVSALRAVAGVDRRLAGWYLRREIPAGERAVAAPGRLAHLRAVTTDPRTWRELAWVIGNSLVGWVAAVAALTVAAEALALITTPAWWWALSDPAHQYATLNLGVYTVTSVWLALLTTAIGCVVGALAVALSRGVATAHARAAERALTAP